MNGFQMKIVERALINKDFLDDWELKFINKLKKDFLERDLSTNQNATLNEIAEKLGRARVY